MSTHIGFAKQAGIPLPVTKAIHKAKRALRRGPFKKYRKNIHAETIKRRESNQAIRASRKDLTDTSIDKLVARNTLRRSIRDARLRGKKRKGA